MSPRLTSTVGLVLLIAPAIVAADGLLLRVNLEPGTTHRFALSQQQALNIVLGSLGQQSSKTTLALESDQRVKERRTDGTYVLELTYTRLTLEAERAGRKQRFDSSTANSAAGATRPALLGHVFVTHMSPRGEILAVDGLDAGSEKLFDVQSADPAQQQILQLLRQSFSPELLRDWIQQSAIAYPEDALSVGESWERVVAQSHPLVGPLETRSTYRLIGEETRSGTSCAILDVKIAVAFGHGGKAAGLGQVLGLDDAQARITLLPGKAVGGGRLWVDRQSGLPIEMESSVDMAMKFRIEVVEAKAPRTFDLDLTNRIETTFKRID